jgi:ABC-type lipoprotein release transport system permease subunit
MPEPPALYVPEAQRPRRGFHLLLRTAGDPHAVASAVQSAVWRVDSEQPIAGVQTVEEHIDEQLAGPDLLARVLLQLGLLTLALAAIGIYGVMAYAVTQQGAEIGVRMAMGARPRQILGRVTRQGLTLAAVGLVLGIPLAGGVVYLISGMLRGGTSELGPTQGITVGPMVEVSLLLAAVGLVACALPALRATRVDPVRVLRD